MSRLGENAKRLMLARGWTVKDLSRHSGVEYSTLHNLIVTGTQESLRSDRLEKLAAALDVSTDDLLSDQPALLPPAVAAVVQRVGKYLDPNGWSDIATYIEAKAEELRAAGNEPSPAYGYSEEAAEERSEEDPSQKSA